LVFFVIIIFMNQTSLKLLQEQFPGSVVTGNACKEYNHDQGIFAITPSLILKPKDKAELIDIIAQAQKLKKDDPTLSITARSAGTGLSGGSVNDSLIIDCLNLNNLISLSFDLANPYITVEPGMLYRNFEKHLQGSGMMMPIFPSSRQWCAIGGMIANNAAGENTLKYGAQDSFVIALSVILEDGNEYAIQPVNFNEFQETIARGSKLSQGYADIYELIKNDWEKIQTDPVKSSKNVSGYPLWKALSTNPEEFERGNGVLDLTKIIIGSQGTLGIVTSVTYRLIPETHLSDLVVIPVHDLDRLCNVIQKILSYNPEKLELFDKKTLELAQQFPEEITQSFCTNDYDNFLHILKNDVIPTLLSHAPEMVLLTQLSGEDREECNLQLQQIHDELEDETLLIHDPLYQKMYWAIRYSSLALVAQHSDNSKPAAFLEDLVIPVENFKPFYVELNHLIADEDLHCAIHGHAGNVHLHFYPLLDFTHPDTPGRIKYLSEKFFVLAQKYEGSISGEHNDGIIRTPYLYLMYSSEWITLFEKTKNIFDPQNIFNPGKKVYPKFDIIESVRDDNDPGHFQTR